ncbi:1-(5-phosphoribosyl)-5-[(5-phosphoribosylamino)methylideneamino] imidazole-4-carboxamide isomerase [Candidatus Nitrososphaera gargensis Ga9.2]|uniref:1-(5-phosphoribosyl)-5-[(5-phosphoribosylamino)methylideneamino] imidazole-4-carboxamide isomerase n=1 Tax=Nitrososphaera gargensis (strain Ga9.2) TaxID=1237085 RepID=K0IKU0_NITGG|nr:1-(5-phosphoribosyl)-5-[(5-phosphoribosylamino)methylideneamino]imidazole-4-carboxamide isomerase [Candidatus Nitrososphaera gargensis]AFU59988.1 1-(5-phosphoribosyl)-5-[(5-phosphoribosylamino)methylideneamino] imidazole-4-carboxamide isomerase [Candidatus Nitrososphaera gargensis Ga9.2]
MKVIAAVDIMGGSVVRLVKGDPANKTVYSSDPVETAKKWEAEGADMLHIVDLDAAFASGSSNFELVASIATAVKIPVQVAGGIRTIEKAEEMLAKASRVVIGTMAYSEPETVKRLAKKNPGRVVVSIDQIDGKVMVKGWKESTGITVADAISRFSEMSIDEFLLTSIERDGTLEGPDVRILAEAAKSARIIASGGIASLEDIVKVRSAGCSSVILGKAMYDGRVSIEKVKALA